MNGLRAVAKGEVVYAPKEVENGVIGIEHRDISIPAVLFCFWKQFHEMGNVEDARNSFRQAGLPEHLFDLSMEILIDEGLIVIYYSDGEYVR